MESPVVVLLLFMAAAAPDCARLYCSCSPPVILAEVERAPPAPAARPAPPPPPPPPAQPYNGLRWSSGGGGGGGGGTGRAADERGGDFRRKYVCLRGRAPRGYLSSSPRSSVTLSKVFKEDLSPSRSTIILKTKNAAAKLHAFIVSGFHTDHGVLSEMLHIELVGNNSISDLHPGQRAARAQAGVAAGGGVRRCVLVAPRSPPHSSTELTVIVQRTHSTRKVYACGELTASLPSHTLQDNAVGLCSPKVSRPPRTPRARCRRPAPPPRSRLRRSPESAPEMVYTFIEQAVQPGAHVALKCSAAGEPPPRFRWTLDGQPLQPHHGVVVSEGAEGGAGYVVSSLALGGARVEDGGRYECRATNAHGAVAHSARLNVYGAPYIRTMGTVRAVTGGDVTLSCPYYGFPISSVRWEMASAAGGSGGSGGGARNTADTRHRQTDGLLRITAVDRQRDAGPWVCSVTSPGGELARREVQVVVVSPPVLSPLVFPPGLRAEERTQLSCTVSSGDMPVYFSWLKDGLPLSSALQVEERSAEFFSLLLFKSLSAAHSGQYTCVVTNTAGKANVSAELAIKVPPYWHLEPADAAVLLGGGLTVNCEARGHPPPRIYWTKVDGSSETAVGGPAGGASLDSHILSNGSLRLEAARATHSGRYRCRAENGVEPSIHKTFTLHVNEPARFESSSANITARLGETVRLGCAARGDPPLSAVWSHGGRALPTSDYRMSVSETRTAEGLRSELVVERADRRDSGLYRCQATNPYGRSDHFIHLAVQEPPEPPTNFRVVEVSSRSVRLAWRRPYDGNSPVLGYVVQYRRLGPADRHTDRAEADDADTWAEADTHNVTVSSQPGDAFGASEGATISGLLPAASYAVRAHTMTALFASPHTRALLALTLHEPPSHAPSALRVAPSQNEALSLTWQSPPASTWNGELLGYTVWWWLTAEGGIPGGPTGGAAGMEYATVRGSASTKYTIMGLNHYTRYSISVRAFNRAGAGPASAPVTALTKEGVPSEGPRTVRCRAVSPQSLKLEWSPPPVHAHRGALLGYKLLYRPVHNGQWLEWEVRGGGGIGGEAGVAEVKRVSGVDTLLMALQPHTNYTVQALAYTVAGDGVPAPPLHCVTHHDVPGPPAAIKATASTSTTLVVSWLPPARPNGPILFYTIFYRELGRERPPTSVTVQADADASGSASGEAAVGLGGQVELRGLSEGAAYEAWVSCNTPAGEGEPSAPVATTTTSRAPARVVSFGVAVRVVCGRTLRLACAWRGVPAARTRWLRHDRAVTHDPRAQVTVHGDLLVHEVDSATAGNYTCSAKNMFGSDEITYSVSCAAPPAAPRLLLEQAEHHAARLMWTVAAHAAAPVTGWTVNWRRVAGMEESVSGGEERQLEAGGEAGGVWLRALACGASYRVLAVAHSRAGVSPHSAPLLLRTAPPVESSDAGSSSSSSEAGDTVWSNSSALALDVRRVLRCAARLVRVQWRRADAAHVNAWHDLDLSTQQHDQEVILTGLAAGAWFALRLWTATDAARHHATIYAATTTRTGERTRRPAAFPAESPAAVAPEAETERVLGLVSVAFAALAALATAALLLVLLAKRSVLLPCGGVSGAGDAGEDEERRRSHSASTEKSVCAEQQNLRNCQHDYKHDKLSPESDVYEISPYATFAVGAENNAPSLPGAGVVAATLDHTLQFRTFGHRENDAPPHRAHNPPCRKHPARHRDHRSSEKHHSDCELQQLSRYEKTRPRHCSGPSYCVPMPHTPSAVSTGGAFSEVYAGDSSVESGPGSLSPRAPHHSDHS